MGVGAMGFMGPDQTGPGDPTFNQAPHTEAWASAMSDWLNSSGGGRSFMQPNPRDYLHDNLGAQADRQVNEIGQQQLAGVRRGGQSRGLLDYLNRLGGQDQQMPSFNGPSMGGGY